MQARFEMRGEVVVVELCGRLDFETALPFRKTCLERLNQKMVVFDLGGLSFVGSLGITDFVDTLDKMAQPNPSRVRFCGVSPEFRKLFQSTGLALSEVFDTRDIAIRSFGVAQ